MPHSADLLDPADVAALGHIEIVARWIVDGFLTGLHRSPRKGFSVEFAEFRPYQPGDELRYLDWRVAARADRWVVKQFEEETNLRATLVLDVSRSMAWTGDPARLTKLEYAERLSAALSLLFLRQRDAVGLIRFDERVRSSIPPRVRTGQWKRIVASLAEAGSGKASHAPDALEQAGRIIQRRGWVVLISDLLMEPDEVVHRVRGLRRLGHHVTVLHIIDPAERELPFGHDAIFVDPESEVSVPATIADVRTAYRATVTAAISEWRAALTGTGAAYEVIATDMPFGVPLRRAFSHRARLP
ncbi:MAG: DUF58 domain-containing protein [Gemmatimonadaceae bacterium]